jgi:putative intracellular protease/amidase
MRTTTRRVAHVVTSAALALATLTALVASGAWVTTTQAAAPAPVPVSEATTPAGRGHPSSSGPIVVAVALGATPTVVSDALAPYEVFASSPQFSVYTVAADPRPAATQGGPAVVPTYTFADTTTGRAPTPNVVVVPAVAHPDGAEEAALRGWVSEQARSGALVLGVCNGAAVLASAGLLDGRTATAHWSRLGAFGEQYPKVNWVRGERFVHDGPITTTAGVTSGIPGALEVMAELAGPEEASRVGRGVGYPGWSLAGSTSIATQSFALDDAPVGLNAVIPWGRPTVGIATADGVGEIDLASSFEVFDVSYAARPVPVSVTGTVVTEHGMVLRTTTPDEAPTPTRLAVPGPGGATALDPSLREWANENAVPVDAVHGTGTAAGFTGALQYLARQAGPATAVSAAKMIDYPSADLHLEGNSGIRIPLLLGAGALLVAAAAAAPTWLRRRE